MMHTQPESAGNFQAWQAFEREMRGRRYGASETRDAWLWFLSGWKASNNDRSPLETANTDAGKQ